MRSITVLPMEVEDYIRKLIDRKKREEDLETSFPNPLLREDVLDLLDRFCTVVYFPLEGERNNGFHRTGIPLADGTYVDFVYINTAQTMEKQVFTAAHELGHIWKVDDAVIGALGLVDTPETRELIVNRFAAVLLMPREIFRRSFLSNLKDFRNQDGKVTVLNALRLVVLLMDQFFVPMKSVVLRMAELGHLNERDADYLLGHGDLPENDIETIIGKLITEYGFIKFQKPSGKKWVEGLGDLLERVERDHLLPQEKIKHMRDTFGLPAPGPMAGEWEELVELSAQGGLDS